MTDQPKFEPDKFIVINRKHIENIKCEQDKKAVQTCIDNLLYILNFEKFPDHQYLVCNQDEPYADEVKKVILDGEFDKFKT